ncbi:translation initiation factor eIF4e [Serendipita vermifera]|nr:translation initiation factor eIF4e [Serendipita vermifera]
MSTTSDLTPTSASDPSTESKLTPPPARPSSGARLPSLTQLAARIGPNVATSTSSSSRPRLATSILRSNSQASNLTTATANSNDSTAVIPPSTRPVSPTASERSHASGSLSATLDTSATGSVPPDGIPAPIVDREEKLIRGYKNIPSLNAITERLRRTKLESAQNAGNTTTIVVSAPEAEPIVSAKEEVKEEVKEEEAPQAVTTETEATDASEEHPLQHTWTLYHDTKAKGPITPFSPNSDQPIASPNTEGAAYEAGLTVVGEFKTVEGFCRYFNWLKPPSKLEKSSNYHLFKDGIKPMWEDPANANGGKWALTIKNNPQLLDRCWSWLAMALVGEELDEKDEICGAVVSLRAKIDRIQLWTRSKDDVEAINALGKKLIKLLDISEEQGIGLEFQYNTEERPTPNKFLSIQSNYAQSGYGGYRSSPLTATSTTFAGSPSNPDGSIPSPAVSPHGPVLPLKTQNVAALDAATGAGGAFGTWRSKRVHGPGQ